MTVRPLEEGENNADSFDLPPIVLGGRLSENIMHFGRVLRRAGLPIGPGQVIGGHSCCD